MVGGGGCCCDLEIASLQLQGERLRSLPYEKGAYKCDLFQHSALHLMNKCLCI